MTKFTGSKHMFLVHDNGILTIVPDDMDFPARCRVSIGRLLRGSEGARWQKMNRWDFKVRAQNIRNGR